VSCDELPLYDEPDDELPEETPREAQPESSAPVNANASKPRRNITRTMPGLSSAETKN